MDKNRLAGEYADTYGNMGSDAWNNAYTCYLAGMDACQQLLQQAIEIFNEKANFNKWLLELTESEMSLVIEMMEEYRNQPSDNTQSIDTELAGKIWDAAEEFSNECWCGQCDYCNTVSKRPPDKETFINSLNLDNTQIRDVEDMALNYAANFGKSKPEQFTDEQVGRLHGFIDGYNAAILPTPPND